MPDGCTVGAKIIGDRFYLLKNRDLILGGFRDTIVFEDDVFTKLMIFYSKESSERLER